MKTRNSIYVLSMLLLALSYCAPVAVKKEVLSEKVISEKVEKGKSKHLINVENVAFSSADRFSADMVAKEYEEKKAVKVIEKKVLVKKERSDGWVAFEHYISPAMWFAGTGMIIYGTSGKSHEESYNGWGSYKEEAGNNLSLFGLGFLIASTGFIFTIIGIVDAIRAVDYEDTYSETVSEVVSVDLTESKLPDDTEAYLLLPGYRKQNLKVENGKIDEMIPLVEYFDHFSNAKTASIFVRDKNYKINLGSNEEFLRFVSIYKGLEASP